MILYSFNSSKSRSHFAGFSLRWYKELINNDAIMSALAVTLIVAVVSAVCATLIGTLAAIGIQSMKRKSQSAIMNFTYVPIVSPEIVMGVSLMLLFALFGMKSGMVTLVLAHITFNIPYVILSVMPKLRQMDKHLFDAAMDLGCTPAMAFVKVMLPEIMPGIVTGFLMALTFSLDDFNVSYFVSGDKFQTLPILIYSMVRRRVSPAFARIKRIEYHHCDRRVKKYHNQHYINAGEHAVRFFIFHNSSPSFSSELRNRSVSAILTNIMSISTIEIAAPKLGL
jgi:spermidine/putrescine transport system permease protein